MAHDEWVTSVIGEALDADPRRPAIAFQRIETILSAPLPSNATVATVATVQTIPSPSILQSCHETSPSAGRDRAAVRLDACLGASAKEAGRSGQNPGGQTQGHAGPGRGSRGGDELCHR